MCYFASRSAQVKPGARSVTLRADAAGTPQEAARVYPGNYWLSLMAPPAPAAFPGTGVQGNGFGPAMLTQNHWANYGTHFVWHIEGGKGTKGEVVKFQIRPDPLAQ